MADYKVEPNKAGLKIVTDMVANVTDICSLVTKNSDLVTTLATRLLWLSMYKSKVQLHELDLN